MGNHTKSILCVVLVLLIGLVASGFAKPKKKDKGKVVGAVWSYRAAPESAEEKAGKEISGTFRVYKYEVYQGTRKVGVVKPGGNLTTAITITNWPEMNGKMNLRKTGKKPATWEGRFQKSDGSKWSIKIKVAQR